MDETSDDFSFEHSFVVESRQDSKIVSLELQDSLLNFLSVLKQDEIFADVMLMSDCGASVKAHRIILSAASPYFHTVFTKVPPGADYPVIVLNDVDHNDLKAILEIIYGGKINVENDRIWKIKRIADLLKLKGLVEAQSSQDEPDEEEMSKSDPSPDVIDSDVVSPPVSPVLSYSRSLKPRANLTNALPEPVESSDSDSDDDDFIRKVTPKLTMRPPAAPVTKQIRTPQPSSTETSPEQSPSLLSRKTAWIDTDKISAAKLRSQTSQPARLRQTTLLSITHRMDNKSTPKQDITQSKDYKGGVRNSQSQSKQTSKSVARNDSFKRKSDEKIEGNIKREKPTEENPDLSTTMFDLSPIKVESYSPMQPQPVPSTSAANKKNSSGRKPLSPGKQNIAEEAVTSRKNQQSQNDTMNIFKDFDKIPQYDVKTGMISISPRVDLQKNNGPPPVCKCVKMDDRGYIPSKSEQERMRRRCPVHQYDAEEEVALLECATPADYWCTQLKNTEELYNEGYIKVASPFTPPSSKSRRGRRTDTQHTENLY